MGKASARKKDRKPHGETTGEKTVLLKTAVHAQGRKGAGRKWYLLLTVVLLVTCACYANSLDNAFVFDDDLVITENPGIRGIENIPRLLGLTTGHVSYRPIRMVSYALDYTLNTMLWQHVGNYEGPDKGLYPLGFHIGNIAYHLLTSLLVFLVVLRLAGTHRAALLAAAIFALHPVHTDSVTYLSGRRDILFTLFYLAGFYCFLRYRQSKHLLALAAAFASYALSMGSKEMGVTLPALFLCYDVVHNMPAAEKGRGGLGRRLFYSLKKSVNRSAYLYALLFAGGLAFSYYKVFIASPSYQKSYYGDSALITFLTAAKILARYIQVLLYPVNLIADYSFNAFPLAESLFEPSTAFSLLLIAGIVYALFRLLAGHTLPAFGGIWFFLTLLPVLHIFPHHELLAEHYLYLPSVGFCLAGAVLCDTFMQDGRYRPSITAGVCVILALFSLRIADRNRDWENSRALYERTVSMAPDCARANANLCEVYADEGRLDEALSACRKALTIKPDQIEANNNLGTVYARKGMVEEAIASYRQALVLRPRYAKAYFNIGLLLYQKGDLQGAVDAYTQALAVNPSYAEVRNNLGIAYSAMGRFNDAIDQYRWAQALNPHYADAHYNLGVAYARTGEFEKAIDEYKRALDIKPQYISARTNLAVAYMQRGELDSAIAELEMTVAGNPDYGDAYFNLGYAYSQKGDLTKAVDSYRSAIAKGLQRADVHSNLGNIYLQQGRLDEAIDEYRQSLVLQEQFAGAHNNLAMAYFKKGEYAMAIRHCDRAAELGLNNPALLKDLLPYR
jgi:tetratricopeptide (TPR) repeat protein